MNEQMKVEDVEDGTGGGGGSWKKPFHRRQSVLKRVKKLEGGKRFWQNLAVSARL